MQMCSVPRLDFELAWLQERRNAACLAPASVLLPSFPRQRSLKGVFQKAGCSCKMLWFFVMYFFFLGCFFTQCRLSSTYPAESGTAQVLRHLQRRGWCTGRSDDLLGKGRSVSPLNWLVDAGFRCLSNCGLGLQVCSTWQLKPLCQMFVSTAMLSMQFPQLYLCHCLWSCCKQDCWADYG